MTDIKFYVCEHIILSSTKDCSNADLLPSDQKSLSCVLKVG